jgi:hypothetical protein
VGDIQIQLILSIIVPLIVSAVTAYVVKARAFATNAGTASAAMIGHALDRVVPPTLRPIVITELKALVPNAEAASGSVSGIAARLLAKLGPQFPTVIKDDIVLIVADYVKAFDGGLVNIS